MKPNLFREHPRPIKPQCDQRDDGYSGNYYRMPTSLIFDLFAPWHTRIGAGLRIVDREKWVEKHFGKQKP